MELIVIITFNNCTNQSF